MFWVKGFSVLEVAVEVPCFNNNQWALWGVVFWRQRLLWVAAGCVTILQAERGCFVDFARKTAEYGDFCRILPFLDSSIH